MTNNPTKTKLHQLPQTVSQILEKLKQNNFFNKKSTQKILVAESDSFGLKALIIFPSGNQLVIEKSAYSNNPDPQSALGEVLAQLGCEGKDFPKEAILNCANVIPALLDLPVDDSSSLSSPKMLELVRWEMETLMSEQLSQWTIGWLLMGRGHLSEAQRDEILQEMTEDAQVSASRGGRAPARFGEEAIKREYVTREQLEECLALQENLFLLDDAIDCSWYPKPTDSSKNTSQKGLWSCTAISSAHRREWVNAFDYHKIRLNWIYPIAGVSACSLSLDPKTQHAQILCEIQSGYIACSRIENQQLTQFSHAKCCDHSVTVDEISALCQSLLSTDISNIFYSGQHPRINELVAALSVSLNREMIPVSELLETQCQIDTMISGSPAFNLMHWSSLIGASQHFFDLAATRCAVQLQGKAPPPPIYKQPQIQLYGICALLLLAVAVTEAYFVFSTSSMETQIADNEVKISNIEFINETTNSKSEEYKEVQLKYDKLEQQYNRLKERKYNIESVLIKRQQFAESLLPMIANNLPDKIILHKVTEETWYQLRIEGWSMTQSAIDDFNAQLSRAAEIWNLYISDSPSEVQTGWQKLEGYKFSFTLKLKT
jgi:hypothetical protein